MLSMLLNREFDIFLLLSFFFSAVTVVFIGSPIHEYAHAITAVKLGDPTPKYTGRTTLNPFAHIDLKGALLIILFGFGWAKPVQVNSYYFKNPKRDMALTALAGPISNILLGFIFFFLFKLLGYTSQQGVLFYLSYFCLFAVEINISLAVFNLIPIPPLDGSRILSAFLSDRAYYSIMRYERYFFLFIIFLLFTDVLDYPISLLKGAIFSLFKLLTFWL